MLQFKGLQRVGHNLATEQKQFCPYNKMFICLCSCPVIELGGIWIRLVGPSAGGKMKSRISIMPWNLLILERGKPRGQRGKETKNTVGSRAWLGWGKGRKTRELGAWRQRVSGTQRGKGRETERPRDNDRRD